MTNSPPPRAKGTVCPLFKKDVSRVCHKCELYQKLYGSHPQTGERIDEWRCAFRMMPILQVETAKEARQAGASTDKVATEVAKLHASVQTAQAQTAALVDEIARIQSAPNLVYRSERARLIEDTNDAPKG